MKQRGQQMLAVLGFCTLIMIWYTKRQNRTLMGGLEEVCFYYKQVICSLYSSVFSRRCPAT